MRELRYLIQDVREQTDNTDVNGVKDKEFIRYFNDGVKSLQAIIFKNNPLCSYFQKSVNYTTPIAGRSFDLPQDCYASNAVTFVEVISSTSLDDVYSPLRRCWQEDQNSFQGWYTRNNQIVFTGKKDVSLGYSAKVWYFYRVPRFDKAWATVNSVSGQTVTITVSDADFSNVDRFVSFSDPVTRQIKLSKLPYTVNSPTQITLVGNITTLAAGDIMTMGDGTLTLDMPDEVEPYLMDYVAKRVYGRNNYRLDGSKIEYFSEDEKANIAAIFGDAGQAIQGTPITDTSYLGI
jgi:hypothetical protein